jgi:hypothetical protein
MLCLDPYFVINIKIKNQEVDPQQDPKPSANQSPDQSLQIKDPKVDHRIDAVFV